MERLTGRILGPYQLGDRLRDDGLGAVYRAVHRTLGERRVVWVLRADRLPRSLALEGLRAEAARRHLERDAKLQVHEVGERSGVAYVVLELGDPESRDPGRGLLAESGLGAAVAALGPRAAGRVGSGLEPLVALAVIVLMAAFLFFPVEQPFQRNGQEASVIWSLPILPLAEPTAAPPSLALELPADRVAAEPEAGRAPHATVSVASRVEAALAARAAGDHPRALSLLSGVMRNGHEVVALLVTTHVEYGRALLAADLLDESDGQFEAALQLDPANPYAGAGRRQVGLARDWNVVEAAWLSDPDAAIAVLERIVTIDPSYRDAATKLLAQLIWKADRQLAAGDQAGALQTLLRARELDRDNPDVQQRLAALTPTPLPVQTVPSAPAPVSPIQSAPAPRPGLPALRPAAPVQPAPAPPAPGRPFEPPDRPV